MWYTSLMTQLEKVAEAIQHAGYARELMRGRPASDEGRQALLKLHIDAVQSAWSPELRATVRRGPKVGRAFSEDPVLSLARERRAELQRLYSALNPIRSKHPRPRKTCTAESMGGHLSRFRRQTRELDAELSALLAVNPTGAPRSTRAGGTYRTMADVHAEAHDLYLQLRQNWRHMTTIWHRFEFTYRQNPRLVAQKRERYDAAVSDARALAARLRSVSTSHLTNGR